jgi:hypothetical protein
MEILGKKVSQEKEKSLVNMSSISRVIDIRPSGNTFPLQRPQDFDEYKS